VPRSTLNGIPDLGCCAASTGRRGRPRREHRDTRRAALVTGRPSRSLSASRTSFAVASSASSACADE
jgi:hypothetical protein